MDFFEEITKQTAKIINNTTSSISQVSNLVGTTSEAMGKIIILKSRIDNLNRELKRLYKEIGYTAVHHPDASLEELTKDAQEKYKELKDSEAKIKELKSVIEKSSEATKENLKVNTEATADMLKKDVKTDAEKVSKKLDEEEKAFEETVDKLSEE